MSFNPDISPFPNATPVDEHNWLRTPIEPMPDPNLSVDDQLANALYVAGALRASIRYLHKASKNDPTPDNVDFRSAWLADITHTIIRGRQITIEPASPSISQDRKTGEQKLLGFLPIDQSGIALAGLMRNIAPREHQIGIATILEDAYDPINYYMSTVNERIGLSRATEQEREAFGRQVYGHFVDEDIIRLNDKPGKDFMFLSMADRAAILDEPGGLIHDLRRSDWGEVVKKNGEIVFEVSDALRTISKRDNVLEPNLYPIQLIHKNGMPSKEVMRSDALRQIVRRTNASHIRTFAFPDRWNAPNDEGFTLLRAVDTINQQRYHLIGSNPHNVTANQFALRVAQRLEHHTHEFIANRNRFKSFDNFDPFEYAMRNYGGEKALTDDQDICRMVAFSLKHLDMQAKTAADVGCGPNPYPAMLLLPHAETIDLFEYSKPNRDYMDAFFRGTLAANHIEMWHKFETHMVEGGGDAYIGVFDAVRNMARKRSIQIAQGDIFKLPANSWDIISSYFVGDSISVYREDYRNSIASLTQALTEEGLLITANMLNSKDHIGYNAGDESLFPNISQTTNEIKQAYLDNNLYSIVIETGHSRRTARDGYDGMALVLACHKHAELRSKLEGLIPELQGIGARIVLP